MAGTGPERRRGATRDGAGHPASTLALVVRTGFASALAVVLLQALPGSHVFFARSLDASAETAAGLVGLLVTGLLVARLRRTQAAGDLALALAMALLSAAALLWAAVPYAFELETTGTPGWAAAASHALAAALLVAACRTGGRRVGSGAIAATTAAVVVLAGAAALGALVLSPGTGPPATLLVAVRVLLAAAFGLLALRMAVEADRRPGPLPRAIAVAATLGAVAFLASAVGRSLDVPGVAAADLLRLCAFGVLLGGCVRELVVHWRVVADRAVAEERRRLARDLHDGLAQELAAILRGSEAAAMPDPRIAAAVRRALAETRAAIDGLRHDAAPLDVAVARAVGDAARRTGASVRLDLARDVRAGPRDRRELPSIAAQAVDNAAVHGGAGEVLVRLIDEGGPWLSVTDDGCGFEPTAPVAGHGLQGMRERAAAAGRRLRIRSAPGSGTTIEVRR
jgi:signal transduction histidine kinase